MWTNKAQKKGNLIFQCDLILEFKLKMFHRRFTSYSYFVILESFRLSLNVEMSFKARKS